MEGVLPVKLFCMEYHMAAFLAGFLLDMLLGDPCCLPHPVRLIGWLISKTEKRLTDRRKKPEDERKQSQERQDKKRELRQGIFLVILVLGSTLSVSAVILFSAYFIHPLAGILVEAVMTYQILAAKCLKVESMKVYHFLKKHDTEGARRAVSMIVGRDTMNLNEEEIAKAAIETVAENASDGVIAPMLFTALGGPVLGFGYKAANTMDSMIGYKNDTYLYFGRAAAKLDDLLNFLPSRISAFLMILASFAGGKCFSGKRAFFIYKRDRKKHASPNSGQTESVCAGALGIRLAGDASYFGKIVKKPYIGDALRSAEAEDIRRADRLMYLMAWMGEILCLIIMAMAAGMRGAV